jgi:hypothetical protein
MKYMRKPTLLMRAGWVSEAYLREASSFEEGRHPRSPNPQRQQQRVACEMVMEFVIDWTE